MIKKGTIPDCEHTEGTTVRSSKAEHRTLRANGRILTIAEPQHLQRTPGNFLEQEIS